MFSGPCFNVAVVGTRLFEGNLFECFPPSSTMTRHAGSRAANPVVGPGP